VGLESIRLVDPNPWQLLPPPRQLVAAPRELLLGREQLEPGGQPLFTCPGLVLCHRRHRSSLLSVATSGASDRLLGLTTAVIAPPEREAARRLGACPQADRRACGGRSVPEPGPWPRRRRTRSGGDQRHGGPRASTRGVPPRAGSWSTLPACPPLGPSRIRET